MFAPAARLSPLVRDKQPSRVSNITFVKNAIWAQDLSSGHAVEGHISDVPQSTGFNPPER